MNVNVNSVNGGTQYSSYPAPNHVCLSSHTSIGDDNNITVIAEPIFNSNSINGKIKKGIQVVGPFQILLDPVSNRIGAGIDIKKSHTVVGIPEVRIGRDHGNLPCEWIPPHLSTE